MKIHNLPDSSLKSPLGILYAFLSLAGYLSFSTACHHYQDVKVMWAAPFRLHMAGFFAACMQVVDFIGRVICYKNLPIHVALAVNYCTPVWATILEPWFVPGEYGWPMSFYRFLCSIVICLGIAADGYGSDVVWNSKAWIAVFAGLLSAFFRVSQNLFIRNLVRDRVVRIPFYFWYLHRGLIILAVTDIAYRLNLQAPIDFENEVFLMHSVVAFLAIVGSAGIILSHDYIPASDAIIIRTLEIPLGGIVGISLFKESANLISCAGWIVAFLGCVFMQCKLSAPHYQKDGLDEERSTQSISSTSTYGTTSEENVLKQFGAY